MQVHMRTANWRDTMCTSTCSSTCIAYHILCTWDRVRYRGQKLARHARNTRTTAMRDRFGGGSSRKASRSCSSRIGVCVRISHAWLAGYWRWPIPFSQSFVFGRTVWTCDNSQSRARTFEPSHPAIGINCSLSRPANLKVIHIFLLHMFFCACSVFVNRKASNFAAR